MPEVKGFLEQMLLELRVTPADVRGKARSVADFEYLFVQLADGSLFSHVFTFAENRQKLMRSIPLLSVLRTEDRGQSAMGRGFHRLHIWFMHCRRWQWY